MFTNDLSVFRKHVCLCGEVFEILDLMVSLFAFFKEKGLSTSPSALPSDVGQGEAVRSGSDEQWDKSDDRATAFRLALQTFRW